MPHSPYRTTVYPPIQSLHSYRQNLNQHRIDVDNGNSDKYAADDLLDTGEALLEQCDFLEAKLKIKKREYTQLVVQNETLKQENEALKEKNEAQEAKIAALKIELDKARAEEQMDSSGDELGGLGGEANPQDADSQVDKAENSKENQISLKTTEES